MDRFKQKNGLRAVFCALKNILSIAVTHRQVVSLEG